MFNQKNFSTSVKLLFISLITLSSFHSFADSDNFDDFFAARDKELEKLEKANCQESMAILEKGEVLMGSTADLYIFSDVKEKCEKQLAKEFGSTQIELQTIGETGGKLCQMEAQLSGEAEGTLGRSVIAGCETEFIGNIYKHLKEKK